MFWNKKFQNKEQKVPKLVELEQKVPEMHKRFQVGTKSS